MAEKKKYTIQIQGLLVEVSEDVYLTYHQMSARDHFLRRKDKKHGLVFYTALDTDEMLGEEIIPDQDSLSVEDTVIAELMVEELQKCLDLLSDSERSLITAMFYEGLSERELSEKTGVHHMTIHNRKIRILKKLKKMMEK